MVRLDITTYYCLPDGRRAFFLPEGKKKAPM